MARYSEPYLAAKPGAGGSTRWYWQPGPALRAQGWITRRLAPDQVFRGPRPPLAVIEAARAVNADVAAAADPPSPGLRRGLGTLADAAARYRESPRFTKLADKTRAEYGYHLAALEAWAGDAPVRQITRRAVQAYYQSLYDRSAASANARLRVLRILLGFALDQGFSETNAASKPKLAGTPPRLRVWSPAELAAAIAAADGLGLASIGDAVLLAATTGQRQGDILALERGAWAAGKLRLKQSKRGAQVAVPLLAPLEDRLKSAAERKLARGWAAEPALLVAEPTGRAWRANAFRKRFAQVRTAAAESVPSVASAWFLDLRDTAVTNLALAGCTVPEICAITGHAEAGAYTVLKHYLALGEELAENAIEKLVKWEEAKR
jgi:hypothetical protein